MGRERFLLSNELDCRGLACPRPVIETKKALAALASDSLVVLVDNPVAKENVVKFATAERCGVSIESRDDQFAIRITKLGGNTSDRQSAPALPSDGMVWLITQDTLGHGSKELGSILMKSFFYTLTEQAAPKKLLFINSGVMLTLADSPVLAHIQTLAERGTEVLSCGTCLDYYAVKDRLAVGGVTNMYTIIESLSAGRSATL